MSVKVHEAFSLDSAQDRYLYFDHFLGDQLKDEWDTITDGTGVVAVIDAQTGGIVRLTTGNAANNDTQIHWGDMRTLLVSKKVTIEYRAKLNHITFILAELMIMFDFSHYVRFFVQENAGGAADWQIETRDAAQTTFTSGITIDTDYHIFRIECFPTGEVHFYIDDVETANSPITVAANIPNEYLQPMFFFRTLENATKSMDLDYVVVRQER